MVQDQCWCMPPPLWCKLYEVSGSKLLSACCYPQIVTPIEIKATEDLLNNKPKIIFVVKLSL